MNRRIIKSIIKKKFNDWIESIDDASLRLMVKKDSVITGGSIASLLMKEKVNDYDIYFTNINTTKAVAEYYVGKFITLHENSPNSKTSIPEVYVDKDRVRIRIKSAGVVGEQTDESQYQYFEGRPIEEGEEYVEQAIEDRLSAADELDGNMLSELKEKPRYRPVFLSDNAITLSNDIQLIIRFYGTPEEIHSNFDYVHCTNYWVSETNNLELKSHALESLLTKELYYFGSKYPICSFIRARKYIRRGWHINAGQMLKICLQISELDLTDINVLEDQLTGVDTAYFANLISALRKKRDSDPNFHVNMPYVASIVDKIF